jgi:hypothetical protein
MKITRFGLVVIVALLIESCAQNRSEEHFGEEYVLAEEEIELTSQSMSEPPAAAYISSSAALENPGDTTRKLIRTANLKFKVNNVIKATYDIENIAVKHDGFVENTNLASQINRTEETPVKEDSMLLTTYYSVINTLVLRVPDTQLDATLREIAPLVEFMDYRIINAQDVTLDMLSNQLEQERLARYDSRMVTAVGNQGRRLNDVSDAEDNLLRRQAQADGARLANLRVLDRINFSTVTLELYQNQSIRYEVIAKEKKIKPYAIPFGTSLIDALKCGWDIVVDIFLFIVSIWSIIVLGVLVFLCVKYFRKRLSKTKAERNE